MQLSFLNFRRGSGEIQKTSKASSPGKYFIIFSLMSAIIGGFLVVQALSLAIPSSSVLVAKEEIKTGEIFTREMLQVKKVPRVVMPKDRIEKLDEIIGKHAKTSVAPGDPLRKAHIAEIAEGGTLAARLNLEDAKLRAIALTPEASLGLKGVQIGDRVDIIGVMDAMVGEGEIPVSKVIVWGAPVLEVISADKEKESGDKKSNLVVGVTPEQSEKVALALIKGKVLATVNPIGKVEPQQTVGTNPAIVFQH